MNAEYKTIPLLGVNTEVLDDQSPDGLCQEIINLKPKGVPEKPYWVPFEEIESLKNSGDTDFTYTHGIANIKSAFWQLRNQINTDFKSTASTSLKRLVVISATGTRSAIDLIDPVNWSVVKTYLLPTAGSYSMSATRVGEISIINVVRNNQPYKLLYLIDDLFIEQGWPELPQISFDHNQVNFTTPEIEAGTAYGVRQSSDQYYLVRYAFKLFDGSYVKHSLPSLIKVASDADDTNYMVPEFTLDGYINSSLENSAFWKTQISGVSAFATYPKQSEKEALNDGLFYELAFFPSLNKIPVAEWPGSDDPNVQEVTLTVESWLVQRLLNIDSFTNHQFCARTVDSYNQRLLLGGTSTDFKKPTLTIDSATTSAGAISELMTLESDSYSNIAYDDDDRDDDGSGYSPYQVEETEAFAIFDPVGTKVVKTATILASNSTAGLTDVTPGGTTVPDIDYTLDFATYSGSKIKLNILRTESDLYGQPFEESMTVQIELGPDDGLSTVTDTFTFDVRIGDDTPGNRLLISNFSTSGGSSTDYNIYHEVEITTNNGTYKRVTEQVYSNTTTDFTFPKIIGYPDQRATRYRVVIQNGSDYEIVFDKSLIQHPSSNYSYAILEDAEATYTLGDGTLTTVPDTAVNDVISYSRNQLTASITGQPLTFEAANNYRVGSKENDTILGFAVNSLDISQGQFGQYPLYVLTNKSIWALEQSSDPSVAFGSLVPVNTFNGIDNPQAVCNADRIVIAADQNYIYSLSGNTVTRIDQAISQDDDYDSFLKGIKIGYHKAQDYAEIIFSNPSFDYSWIFNIRYNTWYKGTEVSRFFFYDQPVLYSITNDDTVKDFSQKNDLTPVAWSLKTRPININSRYVEKKLIKGIIRGRFQQPNEVNSANYSPLNLDVLAWTESLESGFPIVDLFYQQEVSKDIWVHTKYGPFNAFSFELSGTSHQKGSYLNEIEINYQNRNTNRIRR